MNERIRELALQAGAVYSDDHAVSLLDDEIEKFAELILTEVISTIYRSDISDRKQERLVDELAYKFGLK